MTVVDAQAATTDAQAADDDAAPSTSGRVRRRLGGVKAVRAGHVLAVVAVLFAIVAGYALLRVAGEEHYQSCVAEAQARYGFNGPGLASLGRVRALDECSRSVL